MTPAPSMPAPQQPTPVPVPVFPRADTRGEKAEKFAVAFFIGDKAQTMDFDCGNGLSAALTALGIAIKCWPWVHTFTIWNKDTEETVCHVPLVQALNLCHPYLQKLAPVPLPVAKATEAPEKPFDELMRDARVKRQARQNPQ